MRARGRPRAAALAVAVLAAAHAPGALASPPAHVFSEAARHAGSIRGAAARLGDAACVPEPGASALGDRAEGVDYAAPFSDAERFPASFAFGVASSAFQVEGDGGDRPRSTWDDFADQRPPLGDEARAGIRHHEHFADDVAYMARAGVKNYRLSLSWPRLMNEDRTANEDGYRFYARLLTQLEKHGIVPHVTLHHWDVPAFLCAPDPATANDATLGAVDPEAEQHATSACPGAWLDPGIVETFATYARHAFERLGPRVRHWTTLNEPKTVANLGYGSGAHAPGIVSATAPFVAGHNMLLAHAKAARVYREAFAASQRGAISLNVNADWREPLRANDPRDRAASDRAMEEELGWFADPLFGATGDYPASMRERYGDALPTFTREQSESLRGSCDFFALNHYTSLYVRDAPESVATNSYLPGRAIDWRETAIGPDCATEIGPVSSEPWLRDVPWGLRKTLAYVARRYGAPPTVVTENGVAERAEGSLGEALNDEGRVRFMNGYLRATLRAIEEDGADVRGYFAWSFFDNFEWADGTSQRFGMVHVDYDGRLGGAWMARRPKRSLTQYREFLTGRRSEGGEVVGSTRANAPRRGDAAAAEGEAAASAAESGDGTYAPFEWEATAAPLEPTLATLGEAPRRASRPRRSGPSESSAAAAAAARERRGGRARRLGELGASGGDDDGASLDPETSAGMALAAAEEALSRAERSRGTLGPDPVADEMLEQAHRVLSRAEVPSVDALVHEAQDALTHARAEQMAAQEEFELATGGGGGDGSDSGDASASLGVKDGVVFLEEDLEEDTEGVVGAVAGTLGPVGAATAIGVGFGLLLIGVQVFCNSLRVDKRGCGTNEGEVRSLVAEKSRNDDGNKRAKKPNKKAGGGSYKSGDDGKA